MLYWRLVEIGEKARHPLVLQAYDMLFNIGIDIFISTRSFLNK